MIYRINKASASGLNPEAVHRTIRRRSRYCMSVGSTEKGEDDVRYALTGRTRQPQICRPFQRHTPRRLRVVLPFLRNPIHNHQIVRINRTSLKPIDPRPQFLTNRFRITVLIHRSNQRFLRIIDIRRRTSLATLNTPILVLIFSGNLPEVLRQRTSIRITQRDERNLA